MKPSIAYVLKGFPVLSETFISSEIHRVERAGVAVRLFVVKPYDERERHPFVDRIEAEKTYLPPTTRIGQGTRLRWLAANARPFVPSLRRCLRRRPRGVLWAAGIALIEAVLTRRRFFSWPRLSYIRDLMLALAVADRVLAAPEIRHLHAHFAHDTATVTWLASGITGLPFSFTAHAKDIYAHRMNPRGLLRRKLAAATFVVTCTGANREHLAEQANGTPVHLVYHGLNDDFRRFLADDPLPDPGERNGDRFRILGVGRLVRKKGFDVLVEACAPLDRHGLAYAMDLAGEDDDVGDIVRVGDDLRARIERLGLDGRVRLLGRTGQREVYDLYRRASVLCLPCRVLEDGDRDGIPNVLLEAMACGVPVVSTPVSGIPELVEDGVNGLLVPPDDPDALARAIRRLHDEPELARRLGEAGKATVRDRFDGDLPAARLAELFTEATK